MFVELSTIKLKFHTSYKLLPAVIIIFQQYYYYSIIIIIIFKCLMDYDSDIIRKDLYILLHGKLRKVYYCFKFGNISSLNLTLTPESKKYHLSCIVCKNFSFSLYTCVCVCVEIILMFILSSLKHLDQNTWFIF